MDFLSLLQQSGFNPGAAGGAAAPGMGAASQPGFLQMLMQKFGGGAQPAPSGSAEGGIGGVAPPMPAPDPSMPMRPLDQIGGAAGGSMAGNAGPSAMQKGIGSGLMGLGKSMSAQGAAPSPSPAPQSRPISQFQPPQYTPPGQMGANRPAMMPPFYRG
jgi:hypothetical protein